MIGDLGAIFDSYQKRLNEFVDEDGNVTDMEEFTRAQNEFNDVINGQGDTRVRLFAELKLTDNL
jgi:hypothetical protein